MTQNNKENEDILVFKVEKACSGMPHWIHFLYHVRIFFLSNNDDL